MLTSHQQQALIYQNSVIPSQEQGVQFVINHSKTMQIPITIALETKMKIYENSKKLYRNFYKSAQALASIERAVGKKIPT